MISPITIQQITDRINIVEVIGDFVKLEQRGMNYFGHCPFHHDKTSSFGISSAKEIFRCFNCGKNGNAISFMMEYRKYSYVEVLRAL